ncbi:MAG: GNAT family N-acetyltransferase [Clostridia bacterium]|nr:GNAT family N-acetyltransferase [Clostridia bacterium]
MSNTPLETTRLILRQFMPDDWQDLLEIARSKEASPYAYADFTWPTDEAWAKESADYMATDSDMWAMARKEDGKVICFINCNRMNDTGYMDVGHVMNMAYAGNGYEEEGLGALYQHLFDTTDAVGIIAGWALEDEEKIAPLLSIGMQIAEQGNGEAFDGSKRSFVHCILKLTKEEWEQKKKAECI